MELTVEGFIDRWRNADGNERQNYQLFLTELTQVLDLPKPEPAHSDDHDNAYVFERKVEFHNADGTRSHGFIDLYRRGSFVLEAKQTRAALGASAWQDSMLRAHGQAQQYARALPAEEGRPPFLIVVDVGRSIELYSEFTRSGGAYVPFPDPRSHRIPLTFLDAEHYRERLRAVWLDPMSLDPSQRSARVTRAIAADLAKLAEALEKADYDPDEVAGFLMRGLFTMFAEDVGLLPKRCFTELLEYSLDHPDQLTPLVHGLWKTMNEGGFAPSIRHDVLRFNGGLFADQRVLPLDRKQIELLLEASRADWRDVEPAIFGTLLERALDPRERHKLGAHYTPRAYVERLVMPTVIEPLRSEWADVQGAVTMLVERGKQKEAIDEARGFLRRLGAVRVLDPACGSGNFLYVTLEHLKRLEGEVVNTLDDLGHTQAMLEETGLTVDPHQMLGLESNPRAARIAEAVLWIGYLQWHFRTRGDVQPPEPVLHDYHNIENRDAVLDWDDAVHATDEHGNFITHWDGRTTKPHPTTGEEVPDESAQVLEMRYVNPRKAEWPEADFVVGNPPFLGASQMRSALGNGYVDALRKTYDQVSESTDYVMYWWHKAAGLARAGKIRRFGFITTNSIRQVFNRRIVQHHLEQKKPLSLVFAVPDHPWVDSSDGAAVRIAMTVGEGGEASGVLMWLRSEAKGSAEGRDVEFDRRHGKLHPNLRVGPDVTASVGLLSNAEISSPGVKLHGSGFIVTRDQAAQLGVTRLPELRRHIREYRNGRDITKTPRDVLVVDLFGLGVEDVRSLYPEVYQWVYERVKPERDQNNRATYRDNWWIFGEPRAEFRPALFGLNRYISTVETSRHRFFVFLDASILADNKLINIASSDGFVLGVISSRSHVVWSHALGSWLGVGNDSVYVKTRCFETFPFPDLETPYRPEIARLAEQLDAHRKARQELHPKLTITGMYNVLEKLRAGEELTEKDREIHEQGLVAVLGQLHDDLDRAVLAAYGWSDLAVALVGKPGGTTPSRAKSPEQEQAEEELLGRLVRLNAERAAEEARGVVRWLRPEFQAPEGARPAQPGLLPEEVAEQVAAKTAGKRAWPKLLSEQVRAVRSALAVQPGPAPPQQIAREFKRAQTRRVGELLETLAALGQARQVDDGRFTL